MDSNPALLDVLFHTIRGGLRPDPVLTVTEWADRYRYLSNKASAEPGKWRTDRTPYLKEIMDALSPSSPIEEVIFAKGAQIGATEASNNWIGYVVDQAPGPMLGVLPTVELAKRTSKQRIAPLIETTPRLREKIRPARERDSGNNVLEKEFPGGRLVLTGANSAVGLRSMPARYLLIDEASAAPQDVEGEGDPLQLARARTRTFTRRKIFIISTPTIEGRCHITQLFRTTDQRYYHVPCPFCLFKQVLKWSNIKWPEGKPREAQYSCENCQKLIPEYQKTWMLSQGEWRSSNPEAQNPKIAGFHLSSLYSPLGWYSWGDAAEDWVKAQGKQELLRGFINTVLGEPWRDQGYMPNWKRIYSNRESYKVNTIPDGVIFLTAAVDVQKNYLIAEIVGWGEDKQSWSIDVRTFHGDPYQDEIWKGLDALLSEQWRLSNGISLAIRLLAIDSSAFTQAVYSWVRKQHPSRVMAVKGQDHLASVVGIPKAQDVNRNGRIYYKSVKVWPVGVSQIKHEIYGWLGLEKPIKDSEAYPSGYMHFPDGYDEEYFKMLVSEQCVQKITRGGGIKWEWQKIRDRNESLDLRTMNRAAFCVVGGDRWSKETWDGLKRELRLEEQSGELVKANRKRYFQI